MKTNRLAKVESWIFTAALADLRAALAPMLDRAGEYVHERYGGVDAETRAAAIEWDATHGDGAWLESLANMGDGRSSAEGVAGTIVQRFGSLWPSGTPALTIVRDLAVIVRMDATGEMQ